MSHGELCLYVPWAPAVNLKTWAQVELQDETILPNIYIIIMELRNSLTLLSSWHMNIKFLFPNL